MVERTLARGPAVPVAGLVLAAVMATLALNASQAYTLGPVPMEWLGRVAVIGLAGVLWLFRDLYRAPGLFPLLALFAWGVVVTVGNAIVTDYAAMIPVFATTPYLVFVALRAFWALSFIAMLALVFWLFAEGVGDAFVRSLVHLATLVALAAVYLYFAQTNGWWEPERTRVGTALAVGVTAQPTGFTGRFFRAIGTFREPSHLAVWLALPFCLSFARTGWRSRLETLVIGVAIALSVSLGTILALLFGLAGALLVTNPLSRSNLRLIVTIALVFVAALGAFELLAVAYGTKIGFVAALWERIEPILAGGVAASNRGPSILRYTDAFGTVPPLVGVGWGHAALIMATRGAYLAVPTVNSFILTTVASIGLIGVLGWLFVLAAPVVRVVMRPTLRADRLVFMTMAAYGAHLVMLNVYGDEPPLMLAIAMAILGHAAWRHDRVPA